MGSSIKQALLAAALALLASGPAAAQAQLAPPNSIQAWIAKPTKPTPWTAPNQPVTRIADVLARHRGQASWSQDIVVDRDLTGRYIQMAPGEATKTTFWADSRVFWIVRDGAMKVTIEGQAPFVATKNFLVQVPYRTPYRMETVGEKPALRFEVVQTGAAPLYALDETPTPMGGKTYVRAAFTGRGAYDEANRPYKDFETDLVQGGGRGGAFVKDDKTFANIIRGKGQPVPPASNPGHFHVDYNEFWLILEGEIDYLIEGVPFFRSGPGDVVYAPLGRWHRASFGGEGMGTRLAINPRPEGMHSYPAGAE